MGTSSPPLEIVITGDSSVNGSNLIVTSYNDYLAGEPEKLLLLLLFTPPAIRYRRTRVHSIGWQRIFVMDNEEK